MERAAKCKHDVLVTSPPVSFTHFRHCPPAVGLRTPLTTRGRRVIPVWKQWFERHREWRYVTCDKLPVGIEFHTAHCRLSDRRGWPDGAGRRLLSAQYWARLLRKVLGQYQYHPILASIGQYPNTGIVRTLLESPQFWSPVSWPLSNDMFVWFMVNQSTLMSTICDTTSLRHGTSRMLVASALQWVMG